MAAFCPPDSRSTLSSLAATAALDYASRSQALTRLAGSTLGAAISAGGACTIGAATESGSSSGSGKAGATGAGIADRAIERPRIPRMNASSSPKARRI